MAEKKLFGVKIISAYGIFVKGGSLVCPAPYAKHDDDGIGNCFEIFNNKISAELTKKRYGNPKDFIIRKLDIIYK